MEGEKQIYLIRHGETDYNRQGIIQGRGVDTSLNEIGIAQAQSFFETYHKVQFAKIFVSALQRTEQTVALFIQLGIPVERWPELDELHWGMHEGKPTGRNMRRIYKEVVAHWRTGRLDHRIPGGESIVELSTRQRLFIDYLKTLDPGNFLICSHGRAIRALLCNLTGRPLTNMDDFPHRNVGLYRLSFVDPYWEIKDFNRTDHLK